MDPADEQDMENSGGGPNCSNGTNGTNGTNGQHQTPEGSMYQEENDESDLDDEPQDDEDSLSQPLQANSQAMDITSAHSLAHLSNLMNSQIMKIRMERNEVDMLGGRSNLDPLQVASNILFSPLYMPPTAPPPPLSMPTPSQNNHPQVAENPGNIAENHAVTCAASSSRVPAALPKDSVPPRRNNGESSQGNSRNNGEARDGEARASSANSTHTPGSNWSFEEQFRQLYELDDNPERRVFLDELFSFMQSRGTPISRLPIMAKSVLDLYELYKLVVLRGGLVEVINKKLWQEIIKGLRLPASITSAAFTLRTQYMKYLYPYEREKEKLSTTEQLQTAIETNRRESRRNNYAAYTNNENLMPRTQHSTALQNSLPLSIAQMAVAANESQHHGPQSLVVNGHPHAPQHHPQHLAPNLSPSVQLSSQVSEYMMRILRDRIPTNGIIPHQGNSPTPPPGTVEGFKSGLEMPRLNLWNICPSGYPGNNNMYAPGMGQPSSFSPPTSQSPLAPANSPEPQREALDLANSGHRADPISSPTTNRPANTPPSSSDAKRSQESTDLASPSPKRKLVLSDEGGNNTIGTYHTVHIKQVPSLGENGKKQLEISVQIDGILYEGVLAPKHDEDSDESMSPNNNNNNHNNNNNNNNNGKRTHNENET
ncbi:protein dead ringer-like [Pogonomyrmex barbatus]|uniref:Protein dead ringer-like n=1 Tax=Pogonomyrmex barbatus TaxID=144034 RepID=A0A6I9W7B9_9HYME|nr:protein dead ringer-like [Pogonomyrmex barbatus]